jgi:hypothetical protein
VDINLTVFVMTGVAYYFNTFLLNKAANLFAKCTERTLTPNVDQFRIFVLIGFFDWAGSSSSVQRASVKISPVILLLLDPLLH